MKNNSRLKWIVLFALLAILASLVYGSGYFQSLTNQASTPPSTIQVEEETPLTPSPTPLPKFVAPIEIIGNNLAVTANPHGSVLLIDSNNKQWFIPKDQLIKNEFPVTGGIYPLGVVAVYQFSEEKGVNFITIINDESIKKITLKDNGVIFSCTKCNGPYLTWLPIKYTDGLKKVDTFTSTAIKYWRARMENSGACIVAGKVFSEAKSCKRAPTKTPVPTNTSLPSPTPTSTITSGG